ncbi:MAG: 50S ribosomal protein L15 [Bacteroidetes Order II. Incertae sedis bacterium]|nr:50S ribosomal protein L15 [Bacteroidetes Order II. bacterium]
MNLSNLQPAAGSTRNRKRVGRGQGSGTGKTSARGHNGAKSRSGAKFRAWFEGGQMPLQRRLPKFGFKNRFRVSYNPINLTRLSQLIEEGRLNPTEPIVPETFVALGLAGKSDLIKVLGSGEIAVALNVTAHAFSESAKAKIEGAGGSVTVAGQGKEIS